jgi:hydroxyacylglutathione hydrolase
MCRSILTYTFTLLVLVISVAYIYIEMKKNQYNEEMKKITTKTKIVPKFFFVNAFLHPISNSKYILIDTLTPGSEFNILTEMSSRGIKTFELLLILITHYHQDHAGSAKAMQDASKAPIGVPKLESNYLKNGLPLPKTTSHNKYIESVMKHFPQNMSSIPFEVKYEFEGGEVLEEFDNIKIISTPGHTNGSISAITESGDCFIGDLLCGAPFTANYPSLHHFMVYENPFIVKESISKILNEKSCKFYFPGHGMPFSRESLQKWFNENQNIEEMILQK